MSTLYVKVTDSCIMQCPFCYVKQANTEVSIDAFVQTLDAHLEITKVVLHGGEPLLHIIRCQEIVGICNERNIPISITSSFALELTEEHKALLLKLNDQEGISIATSYSYDRFAWQKDKEMIFTENIRWLNENNIPFTLLVTLSPMHMIHQPPDVLMRIINTIKPTNITLERVYGEDAATAVYSQSTDDYLSEMFTLMPKEKNNLRAWMTDAIEKNIPVFNPHCDSLTLETDGSLTGCPNLCGKAPLPQRRIECLECEFFKWCQGDCPSFREVCNFPKNTFKKVMEGDL